MEKKSVALIPRTTSAITLILLIIAYFFTGRLAQFAELSLYALAGMGVPMTIAMHRSLVVLLGHLAWVALGSTILALVPRPKPFFGGGGGGKDDGMGQHHTNNKDHDDSDELTTTKGKEQITKEKGQTRNQMKMNFKWYTNKWNTQWLFPTLGGYFISSWFFNIADFINQIVLPSSVFEFAGEGVVAQLINPENNDLAASLVGYIAPCISAPWWEEVLYRGFVLPALCMHVGFWWGIFLSGVIFSIHHVSATGAIPLAILGWLWAYIYSKSGNLLVTILIHAMWNSRVFFGSWLGL